MQNKVFFSQPALDQWLSAGKVDLRGSELTILEEERRYDIAEALYVVREVSGTPDVHRLVGRVKPKERLEREGAEVFDTSIILGENAYDVVPGWLGVPIGTFEDRRPKPARASGRFEDEPKTDEDMLARFDLKSLK
jgi:hypothetical protein